MIQDPNMREKSTRSFIFLLNALVSFENNHDFYNADVKLTIKTISSKLSNGLKEENY